MASEKSSFWTNVRTRMRARLVSGLLVMVPVGITLYILRWLFDFMSDILADPVRNALKEWTKDAQVERWLSASTLLEYIVVGAISIAGDHLFAANGRDIGSSQRPARQIRKAPAAAKPRTDKRPGGQPQSRINKRPPGPSTTRPVPIGMQAKGRSRS